MWPWHPAPTYQWRFKGANIAGATAASYIDCLGYGRGCGAYDVVVQELDGDRDEQQRHAGSVGIAMTNPSFEEDVFSTSPGYVSGNWPITGWEALGGHGINPAEDGQSPFADNGTIRTGSQWRSCRRTARSPRP